MDLNAPYVHQAIILMELLDAFHVSAILQAPLEGLLLALQVEHAVVIFCLDTLDLNVMTVECNSTRLETLAMVIVFLSC